MTLKRLMVRIYTTSTREYSHYNYTIIKNHQNRHFYIYLGYINEKLFGMSSYRKYFRELESMGLGLLNAVSDVSGLLLVEFLGPVFGHSKTHRNCERFFFVIFSFPTM